MRTFIIAATMSFVLLATAPAGAHATLDRAEPRVGSSVSSPPREVTLWFSQKLEPSFSSARVYNASGARVDQGRARVDGSVLHVSLKSLGPGTYRVRWRVLSVDTHTTEGSFTFRVGD
jgi:methionine-rich copper-binding protein CopC